MLLFPTNVLEQAGELGFSLSSLGRNLLKVSGSCSPRRLCCVLVLIQQKFKPPRSFGIPQLF